MSADLYGDWDVDISTPVGTLHVVYTFTERDGAVSGSATGRHETTPLTDVFVADGGLQVSWRQTVTRPMRLRLRFDVEIDGDRMHGRSRAGRLPPSTVTGVRRS